IHDGKLAHKIDKKSCALSPVVNAALKEHDIPAIFATATSAGHFVKLQRQIEQIGRCEIFLCFAVRVDKDVDKRTQKYAGVGLIHKPSLNRREPVCQAGTTPPGASPASHPSLGSGLGGCQFGIFGAGLGLLVSGAGSS